jgi:hypothetical protein
MPDLMDFDPQNPIQPIRKDWPKAQDLGLPAWAGEQLQEAVQEERAHMSIDEALGDLRRGHHLDAEVIRGVVRKFLAEGGDELDKRVGAILNFILHPNVRGAWAGEATVAGTTLGVVSDVHIGDPVCLGADGITILSGDPPVAEVGPPVVTGVGNPVVILGDTVDSLTLPAGDLDKPETQNGGGTCQT